MVSLRTHWESTSVIGCSVFVVNPDWLRLQLHSKIAERIMQRYYSSRLPSLRNIKVAHCLILIVTIRGFRLSAEQ